MRKNGSSWAFALVAFMQGHREGKQGETMTLVPMEFRRPMGFEGLLDFKGPMEMTLTNQFVEHRRPFFWRSHKNPKKIVAFSSFLKFTKLEMPNI